MDEKTVTKLAFDLVRQHGFIEAQRIAANDRDNNSPGTASFTMHNQICKQLAEFATVGAIYRTTTG